MFMTIFNYTNYMYIYLYYNIIIYMYILSTNSKNGAIRGKSSIIYNLEYFKIIIEYLKENWMKF
ncbi:hypothetical protein C923_01535 [Plasmodium falciparum UGT5.1]|uniref:Uncharacterized protein n=5 Tax=Plasmodium falciparum TaxID=5833 RepID=A0A024WUR1_PLAFA|nr:hypothetical protein PFFVO_01437 [Plasmodium falciparum Vietnam Oak-Knoll (FVO)]ETW43954.1 hypothetical protein PFNF135_01553 [Plasmodium falciparum NF135/5.C10]ETW50450.1 hypothetical protein PFMALIP_01466 [Plasmodium falciparum MaliPS096_E11]EUR75003.1 hypothetical protein PFBG_01443 [Plasmodium falciparum 7G8]EWC77749.1 hypothetical protein C923_01535 [Plasmodium falciparum UGT5.1]